MQSLKFILLALSFLALSPIANADTDVGADASQAAHDVKDATVHVVKKTGEVARDVGHASKNAVDAGKDTVHKATE